MNAIRFWLNDQLVEEFAAPPTTTLLEYLRSHLRLTGTKEGCAEGDCGACTVALLDAESPAGPTYRAINSCLLLLPMLHGQRVYTVEALKRGSVHHPVQKSLVEHLGSQCGYCTPGVVMSLFEACYRTDLDAAWKLDDQMCGNLCRCTGYRPIRDAALEIAGARPDDHFGRLLAAASPVDRGLAYEARGQKFFQPTRIETLLDLVVAHRDHRLVSGATDLGLEVTKRHTRFPCLISLGAIPALRSIEPIDGGWAIGSAARLSDVEAAMADPLPSLARMLRYFGSRQIKHGATLGGNLCTASPIGDSAPVLLALGATAIARSHAGERAIPLDDFFLSYRKTALGPGEVLVRVEVPFPRADARVGAYKVAKRRELDISAVSAGMLVRVDGEGKTIEARIAYGGMAAIPARARHAEEALVGRPWDHETVAGAAAALDRDFTPITDLRGSAWYRATVARNLLLGFHAETSQGGNPHHPDRPSGTVPSEVRS